MERYRVVRDVGHYYVTFTVVEWLPVFIDETACKISHKRGYTQGVRESSLSSVESTSDWGRKQYNSAIEF
jgi:hypothetical protein